MPYLTSVLGQEPSPGFWLRICRFFLACLSDSVAMWVGCGSRNPRKRPDEARVVVGTQAQSVLLKHIQMRSLNSRTGWRNGSVSVSRCDGHAEPNSPMSGRTSRRTHHASTPRMHLNSDQKTCQTLTPTLSPAGCDRL